VTVQLPEWARDSVLPHDVRDDTDAMRQALALARMNVQHGTGGPFAALIVHDASRRVVGIGVNLVGSAKCSVLHAEIVAIMLASEELASWDLGVQGPCTLYTTAEPCAMCMGAIPWTGIRRVVVAARDSDVRDIGFDEGAKPAAWVQSYERRGIAVVQDVLRDEAQLLLRDYVLGGGLMYNGSQLPKETP